MQLQLVFLSKFLLTPLQTDDLNRNLPWGKNMMDFIAKSPQELCPEKLTLPSALIIHLIIIIVITIFIHIACQ